MSSFVIGKEEYIKAAGVIAGIADVKNIWLYDYSQNRNSTPEDYYRRFTECFEMNMLSVQEQYDENVPESDSNEYMETFKAYMQKGKNAAMYPEKLKNIIMDLWQFFRSAQYQTEKEAYYFKMQMYFNSILVALMPYLHSHESECWGEFDIDD